MAPGLPAILVLGVFVWCGTLLTPRNVWDGLRINRGFEITRGALLVHNAQVALISLIFWLWAFVRSISLSFDLGIVSFALAFAAASHGIYLALDFQDRDGWLWRPCAHKVVAPAANSVVVVNYVLGFVMIDDETMRLYFIIAIAYWLLAAAKSVWLANSYEDADPTLSYAAVMDVRSGTGRTR